MPDVDQYMTPAADQGIRRDQWGRYLLPHPDTGIEQAWTRATTLAGTLADRYGLEQWEQRNIVLGIGTRQDLYAQAAAAGPDDKATLNGVIKAAKEAAASKAGANLGSAVHQFTERLDRGERDVTVPDPWRADVDAYRNVMAAHHITPVPGWIERVVLVPEIGVAGTVDRLCTSPNWPHSRIGDVKTGKDILRYGIYEIALQLAIYSRATHWWNPTDGRLYPVTDSVDQDHAVVMHVPVGRGECTLIEVDIAAGWEAVQLALAVRDWRKRKDLAQIATPPAAPAPSSSRNGDTEELGGRLEWLRARIKALPPPARVEAGKAWPEGVPRKADHIVSHAEVDQVAAMLATVEGAHQLPFHSGDPARADSAPEPEAGPAPAPVVEPAPTADHWATRGKELLNGLDDDTGRACADLAGATDVRMTETRYERLDAVVAQVGAPAGAIYLNWRGPQPDIELVPDADKVMAQACGGTKAAALATAKALAKRHELPAPRSLADAATSPLLAALVTAAGRNQHTTPTESSTT